MAGINRLGRGAAKPGTLRPQDPNRFKTEDFFSVDAEDDPEYLRRVIEVEQLANARQGCLLARGAFDKGDSLYMKDELEKARNAELEQRDAEMSKFTQVRSQLVHAPPEDLSDVRPVKRPKVVAKPKVVVRSAQPRTETLSDEVYETDATAGARSDTSPHQADRAQITGRTDHTADVAADDTTAGKLAADSTDIPDKAGEAELTQAATAGLGLAYGSASESDSDDPT